MLVQRVQGQPDTSKYVREKRCAKNMVIVTCLVDLDLKIFLYLTQPCFPVAHFLCHLSLGVFLPNQRQKAAFITYMLYGMFPAKLITKDSATNFQVIVELHDLGESWARDVGALLLRDLGKIVV